jgi:hypothetical protein
MLIVVQNNWQEVVALCTVCTFTPLFMSLIGYSKNIVYAYTSSCLYIAAMHKHKLHHESCIENTSTLSISLFIHMTAIYVTR